MAYATADDVLARLGILAPAFSETSNPSLNDLDSFLDTVAAEIDAGVASRGLGVPLENEPAEALVGVNADGALLLAIDARWPGGVGGDEVAALREDVTARFKTAMAAIADGTHPAIVLVSVGDDDSVGANSFWQEEPDYGLPWSSDAIAAVNESPAVRPGVARGMKL